MAISVAKARSLCNKSELALVTASSPKNLAGLSAARLRQKVALARKLRDKWRDQAQQQRRAKQTAQQARGTSANARSDEKAALFTEVLDRFQKRLEKVEGSDAGPSGGKPKRRNPPRKVRATGHREKRAATREALQEQQEAIALQRSGRQSTPKVSAAKQPVAKKKAAKKKVAKKKVAKKASKATLARKKKAVARVEAARAAADAPRPATVKKKTRRAKTAAKQTRVVQSGAVRIQKHISARGRRNQARRDSR